MAVCVQMKNGNQGEGEKRPGIAINVGEAKQRLGT